ncbi:MAG: hypothetical protein O3A53_19190 [Acidobacteria bacterium]|nr:hypothetical protein [Acidobacteriota bacterium]MDA1236907.1 hypothetical protein [Acidobacteriota bacterium]
MLIARHVYLLTALFLIGCSSAPTEAPPPAATETNSEYLGLPAILLENGVLELKILPTGGPFVDLVLKGDPDKLSPLWAPLRAAKEAGREPPFGSSVGHFVCVDGFGGVSEEERSAGLQNHGEAHRLPWVTVSQAKPSTTTTLVQSVDLPIVKETLERTVRMVDGEHVVYVNSALTSHLGFDRPINWAEHATIGSPFLEPGVTVVDMSANRALTRPYKEPGSPERRHRITSDEEFVWPLAPTVEGGKVDLRAAPVELGSGDHTGHLMTVGGEKAWVTAHHPGKRLLLGYIYNTAEFPWMQTWESYPKEGMLARGLEFGTQAFDLSRRTVVSDGKLFDTPLYQWLPAKSTFTTSFMMFLVETPEGFEGVSDVSVSDGVITVKDKSGTNTVTLPASLAE